MTPEVFPFKLIFEETAKVAEQRVVRYADHYDDGNSVRIRTTLEWHARTRAYYSADLRTLVVLFEVCTGFSFGITPLNYIPPEHFTRTSIDFSEAVRFAVQKADAFKLFVAEKRVPPHEWDVPVSAEEAQ
jgi:hypothetical protein